MATIYIVTWIDSKYNKTHTEEYDDIEGVRQAMRELHVMHAIEVSITKRDSVKIEESKDETVP